MLRLCIAASVLTTCTFAGGFTFVVGSPDAFIFRTQGCNEPAKAQIFATAVGRPRGYRQTAELKVTPASKPGVYTIFPNGSPGDPWVVVLTGTCGKERAGAVIPLGPKGFVRESSKFFPRPPTDAEIDATLKPVVVRGMP
jgi:hypothetical protein